jgi:hypothetical protein
MDNFNSETPLALISAIAFLLSVGAYYANLPILLMLTTATCIWASAFGVNQLSLVCQSVMLYWWHDHQFCNHTLLPRALLTTEVFLFIT